MAEVIQLAPQLRERPEQPSTSLARTRLQLLCDPGSFDEIGSSARHRGSAFGSDRRRPRAELAVMGPEGSVDVIFRRELQQDPECRAALLERYRDEAMSAQLACDRLSVDEVVQPEDVRHRVAASLRSLGGALQPRFRHDNLPQ